MKKLKLKIGRRLEYFMDRQVRKINTKMSNERLGLKSIRQEQAIIIKRNSDSDIVISLHCRSPLHWPKKQ